METLITLWLIWFAACALLVLFGVANPMLRWYDVWVGFFWDRRVKTLYMFPIPTIGCSLNFGALLNPPTEGAPVNRYLMDIPEDIYKKVEAIAIAKGETTGAILKEFIESGIEVEKLLDEAMLEGSQLVRGMNGKHRENERDD